LFNGLSPALTNVAILQLWEQYEWHPKRALNGAAALLADEGWQFDVLFSGEDVYTEYSGVDRLLPLTKLQQYPMVIIPTLEYCWDCNPNLGITENNARLLLDYVDSGGHLVVFAGDNAVDNLLAWNPNTTAMRFYQRLKLAPANASGGNIIRIRDPWPVTYFQTQSATLRESLSTVLEAAGLRHPVRISGSRRAVAALSRGNADRLVIHLVNYDYDRTSDYITPVTNLVLNLAGISSNAVITEHTPTVPNGAILPVQFKDGIATFTVHEIQPWTVLSVTPPPSEIVSTPVTPSGPTTGIIGTPYAYSTGGSASSLGKTAEYQFDWKGDGSDLSAWGPSSQSKTWPVAGTYNVRARARCTTHTSVVSNWSSPLSVGISVPKISVTPTAYDFGNVKVKRSKKASFSARNNGTANLLITSTITGTDTPMFTIATGSGSKTIKPGKSLSIKVTFKPISKGSKSANLEITSNDLVTPTIGIPLSGTGSSAAKG
jgi:hypothetical protein